ncbi:YheC/YheD family protein [Evansella clarkii]|uniref:YheC/YheD family endospore coat-associated protein n=1 Tax=Evansella clarkii TaxID=79879 RepID=UPI000B447549|nr:YheC/YheD family protein [Evansella clarkii]
MRRIGVILPSEKYKLLLKDDPNVRKRVQLYTKAAKKQNCTVCFFRLQDLQPNTTTVNSLIKENGTYKKKRISIPKVIYKRVGHTKKHLPLFESLNQKGVKIFNLYKNNYKWNVWKIVNKNESLSIYQPYTRLASNESIKSMIRKYPSVVIKPNRGEGGKGIMKIEKDGNRRWVLYTKNSKGQWKGKRFTSKLPSVLTKTIKKRKYLVQEGIELATYNGTKFDLRVAVQKNTREKWQLSAIFTKVAGPGQLLTNMSQGGESYLLEEVLRNHPTLHYDHLFPQIKQISLKLAEHLSKYKKGMYDFGFDIGISKDGRLYLFEVNHTNDYPFFSIKNGELAHEEWYEVYKTPIEYAAKLLKQKLRTDKCSLTNARHKLLFRPPCLY